LYSKQFLDTVVYFQIRFWPSGVYLFIVFVISRTRLIWSQIYWWGWNSGYNDPYRTYADDSCSWLTAQRSPCIHLPSTAITAGFNLQLNPLNTGAASIAIYRWRNWAMTNF